MRRIHIIDSCLPASIFLLLFRTIAIVAVGAVGYAYAATGKVTLTMREMMQFVKEHWKDKTNGK
jgi:phage pi2 protein 07